MQSQAKIAKGSMTADARAHMVDLRGPLDELAPSECVMQRSHPLAMRGWDGGMRLEAEEGRWAVMSEHEVRMGIG